MGSSDPRLLSHGVSMSIRVLADGFAQSFDFLETMRIHARAVYHAPIPAATLTCDSHIILSVGYVRAYPTLRIILQAESCLSVKLEMVSRSW